MDSKSYRVRSVSVWLALWTILFSPLPGFSQLIISEFMADNDSVLQDEDGEFSDWIEIHNTSGSTIDLAGWHLTDRTNDLAMWTFPATNIAAGGYVVVFASSKDRAQPGHELHANFSLDDKGEFLALVFPEGTNIASAYRAPYPRQYRDVSYGYQTHGAPHIMRAGEPGYFVTHSPGTSNTNWPALHPLFGDESVARVDIYIGEADWYAIRNGTSQRSLTLRYRQGDIDVTVSNVAMRPRGNTSYWKQPRSFQVSFNTYVPGQDLFGMEKLNFNSEVNDPTSARSKIINEMIHASGLEGSAANHVALVVNFTNGSNAVFFDAIRNNIMTVDDIMMDLQFGSSAANLYKCLYQQWPADLTYRGPTGASYIGNGTTYELKYQGGPDASYDDLADFIDLINNTPSQDFPNEILQHFEMDDFLKRMAVNVLSGSWDDHWFLHNNYYLFRNPIRGKWQMVTFDFDNTLGIDWIGDDWGTKDIYNFGDNNTSVNPLMGRLFQIPEFKNRYSYYLNEMLDTFYTATGLTTRAYQIRDTLIAALPFGSPVISNMKQTERNAYSSQDPYWNYNDFYSSYDFPISHNVPDDYGVTPFFSARRASALSQLMLSNIAPVITDFSFLPDLPAVGDAIQVRVEAFDDASVPLVQFWYAFNSATYTNLPMSLTTGNWYEVTLPAFTTNGTLMYYVDVIDITGRVTYEPYGGSNYAYSVVIDSPSLNLAITELNYHPYLPEGDEVPVSADEDDYEFIELRNTGSSVLQLFGYEISGGISHVFASNALAPGAFALLVRNTAAFEARYGTSLPVVGEYTGKLADSGEEVRLHDPMGRLIRGVSYSDGGAWPGRSDGRGSALEVLDTTGDYNDAANWRSSAEFGGTPGYIGTGPDNRIVINEVLTHTDPPLVDSVELHNTTEAAIDIGGWVLSDSSDNYRKYVIPSGTVIEAEGYLVFYETNSFNQSMGVASNDFAFSGAHGDDLWLLEADASTNLLRFVDHVDFGAARNAESFGRWPNGSGPLYPMATRTFGGTNSGPRVGPVVISELMYHATNDNPDLEFIEIYNASTQAVNLSNWELNKGIDYVFPSNHMLGVGAVLVVLPFDPDAPVNAAKLSSFLAYYGIDLSVDLLGPYAGNLDAAGETVELLRPDDPPAEEPDFRPMLLEDQVRYDDEAPWPTAPDGTGPSLTRIHYANWGNDPANWSGVLFGTPGNYAVSNAWLLTVESNHGSPDPAVGNHVLSPDTVITASVNAVDLQGAIRYTNTGWTLTGHDPAAGASQSFSFAVTNDAVLHWHWATNFALSFATSGDGAVIATNGWYEPGVLVTLQAIPGASNVFAGWSGDIGAIASGSATTPVIDVTMGGPVDLTATFADGFHDLVIASEHGNPVPAEGLHVLPNGSAVNASVEAVIPAGDYQLACSGWLMGGAVVGFGTSNTTTFSMIGDLSLTWQWITNGWLDVSSGNGGTVDGAGWRPLGSVVEISAVPDAGHGFYRWIGDTGLIVSGDVYSAEIAVQMDAPLSLAAEFCQLSGSSNLLMNADFETQGSSAAQAYYWEFGNPDNLGGASGTASREAWRSHDGGLWEATIRGTWAGAGDFGQWSRFISAYEGVTYTARGWFWASDSWTAGGQVMYMIFLGETNEVLGSAVTPLTSLGSFWSERVVAGTAPAGTTSLYFSVYAEDVGDAGALQFDDLEITASTCLNFPELELHQDGTGYDVLMWDSIGGAVYTLQWSTNLMSGFADMTNGVYSTPPLNVMTNADNDSPSTFYQLKIEARQ